MNIPGNIYERFVSNVNPADFSVAVPTFNAGATAYDPNMYSDVIKSITDQNQIAADADTASAAIDANYLTARLDASTEQAKIDAASAADYRANETQKTLAYQENIKAGIASNDARAADTQNTFKGLIDNTKIPSGSSAGNSGGNGSAGSSNGAGSTIPPRTSLLDGLKDLLIGIMKFVLLVTLLSLMGLGIKWCYDNPEKVKAFFNSHNSAPAMLQNTTQMPKYRNSHEQPL